MAHLSGNSYYIEISKGVIIMGHIIYINKKRQGEKNMSDITREEMLEIEEVTNSILSTINLEESPYVDIVALVKKDGFKVEPTEMDIETTGCLFVSNSDQNKQRLIMVNTNFKNPDNETDVVFKKSRFITAHEYGHFILHRDDKAPIYARRDTYHRTEPEELKADYFARSILMPLKQFKLFYELLKEMSNNDEEFIIDLLSKAFKVTKNKVKKRMEDLAVLNQ